jgi:hypothetical protein
MDFETDGMVRLANQLYMQIDTFKAGHGEPDVVHNVAHNLSKSLLDFMDIMTLYEKARVFDGHYEQALADALKETGEELATSVNQN